MGEKIEDLATTGVTKLAEMAKAYDATLTDEQARAVGMGAAISLMAGLQLKSSGKELMSSLANIRSSRDIALARTHIPLSEETRVRKTSKITAVEPPRAGAGSASALKSRTSKSPHPSYVDKQTKGARAESAAHRTLESAGYEILDSKLPGNRGFDKVAIKRNDKGEVTDIMIIESKFRTTGKPTLKGQLSDKWIKVNIDKMVDSTDPKLQKIGELLFANPGLIRRKVNLMDAAGINRWNQVKAPATRLFKE